MNRVWKMVFWQARDSSKRRNKEWFLDLSDYEELVERCKGRCEVTGVEFDFDTQVNGKYPYRPTIDRIDNNLPYCLSNCRMVALFVNLGMNVWGDKVFTDLLTEKRHREMQAKIELGFLFVLTLVLLIGGIAVLSN